MLIPSPITEFLREQIDAAILNQRRLILSSTPAIERAAPLKAIINQIPSLQQLALTAYEIQKAQQLGLINSKIQKAQQLALTAYEIQKAQQLGLINSEIQKAQQLGLINSEIQKALHTSPFSEIQKGLHTSLLQSLDLAIANIKKAAIAPSSAIRSTFDELSESHQSINKLSQAQKLILVQIYKMSQTENQNSFVEWNRVRTSTSKDSKSRSKKRLIERGLIVPNPTKPTKQVKLTRLGKYAARRILATETVNFSRSTIGH